LNPLIILLAAFLAIYCQSSFDLFRNIFGVQLNLLPTLMVYTSLTMGILSVALLSIIGGLLFDSLSANPLGISVVPLFLIGFGMHRFHGLLLREQLHAQFSFGVAASLLVPLLTLLFLFSGEGKPLFGWGTIWQLLVMGLGGGLLTPICFWILDWLNGALIYQPIAQTSFRADRQIKRNRG
jgi:cell shape-determining protein MreD